LSAAWHELFAPLPEDAVVRRKPVAAPELVAAGKADAIAGWESLSIEMSAGPAGLRHVMVTLDANGKPVSAGDWVMFRRQSAEGVTYVHENVGGRLDPDGRFHGTRWRSVMLERSGSDQPEMREATHLPPSAQDIEAIQALVLDVLRLSAQI
jgi:hypothetical protein